MMLKCNSDDMIDKGYRRKQMTTQLTRSTSNKMIAGVAGGIAEGFGWDPTLVRLGFVLLTLFHGGGLLLYLAMWLLMPKAGEISLARQAAANVGTNLETFRSSDRNKVLGYALLGVGGLMLANMLHLSGPIMVVLIIGAGWY